VTDTGPITPDPAKGPFKKKHPRYGGRKKGTPNKSTRNIRDAMTESAVKHGIDGKGTGGLTGFCQWLLANDLKAWTHIFSRLVPLQVAAETTNRGGGAMQVNVISVPRGVYFSPEQADQIMTTGVSAMPIIEAAVNEAAANAIVEGVIVAEEEEISKEEEEVLDPPPAIPENVVVMRAGPPIPRRD
jgi:hypothetical protein